MATDRFLVATRANFWRPKPFEKHCNAEPPYDLTIDPGVTLFQDAVSGWASQEAQDTCSLTYKYNYQGPRATGAGVQKNEKKNCLLGETGS